MKNTHPNIESFLKDLAYNNSENALKHIYLAYSSYIARYISLYVKSKHTIEELLSDVFYTIWENRQALPDVENFNAYIYKIAKFKALNHLRENKISTIDIDEIPIDLFNYTTTTAEDEYISKEIVAAINAAIENLPPKCKLAFKLVREDKMKYKDAAEHLDISVKTLEIHLASAMKKIRDKLSDLIST